MHDPHNHSKAAAVLVYCGERDVRRGWRFVLLAALMTAGLFAMLPFADLLTPRAEPDLTLRIIETQTINQPPPVVDQPPPAPAPPSAQVKPELQQPQQLPTPPPLNLPIKLSNSLATWDNAPRLPLSSIFTNQPISTDLNADTAVELAMTLEINTDFKLIDTALAENLVFELAEVDRPPRAIVQTPPQYPHQAIRRGTEGFAELRFTVTDQGTVTDIQVADAQPAGVFDAAATEAVRNWRFEPGARNGQPVAVWVQIRLDFKLN